MSRKSKTLFISFAFTVSAWLVSAPAARGQVKVQGRIQVVLGRGNAEIEDPKPPDPAVLPLVNVDEEMSGYIGRAREMIAAKDYAGAIEILQALLDRTEQCFVSTEDPRRFVSLSVKAGEVIGRMPSEGMKLYRGLYDPRAERLFRSAADRLDESALRNIIDRYLYTSYGSRALSLLGAVLFDRGEFSQAARCWRRVVEVNRTNVAATALKNEASLLARIAVAHHFAGESAHATKAAELLAEKYPNTVAVFGGRDENVVEFVRRMFAKSPLLTEVRYYEEGWPSLAGSPDSVAVMSPVRPVLSPRWSTIEGDISKKHNIIIQPNVPVFRGGGRVTQTLTVSLREGRVVLVRRIGNKNAETVMPAMIHPIVVDKTVMYRTPTGISVHDLLTGEKLWETLEFPLFRQAAKTNVSYGYSVTGSIIVEDTGLWTVTAGGGRIYAPGKLIPGMSYNLFRRMGRSGMDSSALAAFSITEQGRQLWQIGDGQGDSDLIRGGKFLTAPTYATGRLYVLVEYTQSHYLVCLDAQNGRLKWEMMVGQTPVQNIFSGRNRNIGKSRSSPPAVADGRVFVVTNAGVVAAFQSDTGKPLWAYQYRSNSGLSAPPNPIIVTRGRAICLPADCEQALAFRTDTGQLDWSAERTAQRDMTAVDAARLLLSGEGLRIIDATNGLEIWKSEGISGIHGRPAVTPDTVLASGRGEVVRVSLPDFHITRLPLVEPDAILGNIIGIDGKLIAANAAGVSVYSDFEDTRAELTSRMTGASPEEVQKLLYQRAVNAFSAGRPREALTGLLKVRKIAEDKGNSALLSRTSQMLYRTYVSLADHGSSSPVAALGFYNKALEYAYSDRSRGEMLVRLVKYYGNVGGGVKAAELAQEITISYSGTDLADVQIGKEADPFVRDNVDTQRFDGYELGHRMIKDLIARHGQECYGVFDTKASSTLAGAVASNEPEAMVRVADTWRHSKTAPMALLRAAESYYLKSLSLKGSDRRDMLVRSGQNLIRVGREYPDSGLFASAHLGLAMVYKQINPRAMWLGLQGLEEAQGEAVVSFAGVSGSAGEVLKRLSFGPGSLQPVPPAPPGPINPPLMRIFRQSAEEPAMILRDADGRAVRLDDNLFLLLSDGRVAMFDPSEGSFKDAIKWETPPVLDITKAYSPRNIYFLVAGLTTDSTVLVVGSRGGFVGVDVKTAKVLWHHDDRKGTMARIHSITMGDDRLAVLANIDGIYVLDMYSGKKLWEHKMPGRRRFSWLGPPQTAGGILLTRGGRSAGNAGVFDMVTGKLLGDISLGRNTDQAQLTAEGLIVVCDGKSLRLVEPVLGIDQPIWKVDLAAAMAPSILGVTRTHVLVSPGADGGMVELRSLTDYGRIVRSFRTKPVVGDSAAFPVAAIVSGNRLYVVVAGSRFGRSVNMSPAHMYQRSPSLQAFDITTAELLWSADLVPPGRARNRNYNVLPVVIGKNYISILTKESSFRQTSVAMIIGAKTGSVVQRLTLPAPEGMHHMRRVFRHMMLSAPVITTERLEVETHTGLEIYGKQQ
ncbi:MAG: PQQ-binding-like beta-propeller repeat protein [Planctomycetota bacterium]|nr:PQQ-binding-like beta-propeller repeat protein [Planctomycetota bacterium]